MSATILEACRSVRTADPGNPLFLELLDDLRAWRLAKVACHWTENPGALPPGEARDPFHPAALSQVQ